MCGIKSASVQRVYNDLNGLNDLNLLNDPKGKDMRHVSTNVCGIRRRCLIGLRDDGEPKGAEISIKSERGDVVKQRIYNYK